MIIAVTGPAGGGKDTASDYIAKQLGLLHVSGGDTLREMLTSLGLEPKKAALGPFGTFLRTYYGAGVIINRALKTAHEKGIVISGFRSLSEAEVFKQRNAYIIYIDAPEAIRHSRIAERSRSDDAAITRTATLKLLDKQEMNSHSSLAESLESVKPLADAVISNDDTIEEFYQKLDELCRSLVS